MNAATIQIRDYRDVLHYLRDPNVAVTPTGHQTYQCAEHMRRELRAAETECDAGEIETVVRYVSTAKRIQEIGTRLLETAIKLDIGEGYIETLRIIVAQSSRSYVALRIARGLMDERQNARLNVLVDAPC